jgi:hypothetical protein
MARLGLAQQVVSPSPSANLIRDATVGHNHWALEQILRAVRDATTAGELHDHVAHVIAAYTPTTRNAPFAEAVQHGLRFATEPH